ncbi:DUF3160 domain-containing protein [Flavivirga jejuensis]|uniref:DUF3160 domain-containing protein n=1 Tax=Flavivirga jejuensis TaxID=870487 RepID=A0ABT8WVR3_9FLAO|nr:DUF3160 domain-containing protein [Flavivirga jejuensis]MDO5976962.1 DUF3160 domain-containing protein [Flavivirga jejuensis]
MKYYILILISLFLFSCRSENSKKNNSSDSKQVDKIISKNIESEKETTEETIVFEEVDFEMDITKLSLSDIRILRNSFFAKQGYCFMKADLRAYFNTTNWYEKKMEDRWWSEEGGEIIEPISFTKQEQEFINKLKRREDELKSINLKTQNNRTVANMDNIVNLFQLEKVNPKLMDMLDKNGFAIVPNDNIQLFHVYEQNDYQQFPNFVTTDMYMQLFHMYFGYVLRTIEEDKFIKLISDICQSMMKDMNDIATSSSDSSIKNMAQYNETYYAIAYTVLTDKQVEVPSVFENLYHEELHHINEAIDKTSTFLDYNMVEFPYSLYKPRGHYTRTESLKKYFKAMMWLQTAPFCLDNDEQLKRAILSASVLAKNDNSMNNYKALMEPINFIIGAPDNVSFLNLAKLYNDGNYALGELLSNVDIFDNFRKEVKKVADAQNKIKPKLPKGCVDKINFIPQRYLVDNEILQELVDAESNPTKRGYPKGLDVMAAFGSHSAENLLLNELHEGENWDKYPDKLSDLKHKMKDVNWDATLYNKWIKTLLELQKPDNSYPYFMQNAQWQKKDLNASLSSWAELKHDAILYAEQPMAAECGGGGPPAPYTVGYVEPNIKYWSAVIELIDLTKSVLERNNLMTSEIGRITTKMRENAQFLLTASKKELAGKKLSEAEYRQIEYIGSTFEWITLDLVKQKGQYLDGWHNVKGPDKSVAIVADVYTANGNNNPDSGILHVATGDVNDIFVVVEIEGYLYITKGAVLNYHEFKLPLGNRLTDEEWQEMLENNEAPQQPEWIKEIILPIESPKSNEKIFYSSGC